MNKILKMGAWGCLAVGVFLIGAMLVAMPGNIERFGWDALVYMLPLGLLWFVVISSPMVMYVLPDKLKRNAICLAIIGLAELFIFGCVIYSAVTSVFG